MRHRKLFIGAILVVAAIATFLLASRRPNKVEVMESPPVRAKGETRSAVSGPGRLLRPQAVRLSAKSKGWWKAKTPR